MTVLWDSRTVSIAIARSAGEVYEYAGNPANLARWASGLGAAFEWVDGEWVAQTPNGPMKFRFVERNALGVLDHYVCPAPGVEFYVPMRVVPNGEGSEVIFTLFHTPQMSAEEFQRDLGLIQHDLQSLKQLLEATAGAPG